MPPKTNKEWVEEFGVKLAREMGMTVTDTMMRVVPHFPENMEDWLRTLLTEKDKEREEAVAEAENEMKNRWKLSVVNNIALYEKDGVVDYRGLEADIFAEAGRFTPPLTR